MTNEKDREEAQKLREMIPEYGPKGGLLRFRHKLTDEQAASEIARIRAESVQTKEAEIAAILLDTAAVYANYLRGTINASEIIKAEVTHRVAEAVKAERERCIEAVRSERITPENTDDVLLCEDDQTYNRALDHAVAAILSDDQEANRG